MSTSRESLIKKLKAEFRGIMLSAGQHGVTIPELARDYADLNGRPIPLHDLGYNDLNQLLHNDMHDVCSCWKGPDGKLTLFPISHTSTRHIERLISRQRVHKATRFGSVVEQSSMNRNRNNRTGYGGQSTRNNSDWRPSSSVQTKPVTVAKSVQSYNAPAPPNASARHATRSGQYTAAATSVFAQPIVASVPSAVTSSRAILMSAPVNSSMNSVPTTVVTSSDLNTDVPISLRRQILQPRFYQPPIIAPGIPPVHHVPSPKLSSPSAFDDCIQVRGPISASAAFSAARINYSLRQPIPTSFSSRPTLPNTVVRPMFNRLPSPIGFGENQITANTTSTIPTLPNSMGTIIHPALNVQLPSAANAQQPITIVTAQQSALNHSDNRKLPSKNPEIYLKLKQNVIKMLEKYSKRGVDVAIFKSAYEDMFKQRMNIKELFEMSWHDVLLSMDDICYITEYNIVKPRKNVPGENGVIHSNVSPPGYAEQSSLEVVTTKPNDVHKWLTESSTEADSHNSFGKQSFSIKNAKYSQINAIVPPDFTFTVQKLPESQDYTEVLMLQCNSPADFYIQLKSFEKELNYLMALMKRINFDDEALTVLPGNLHAGNACAAWFDPGGWHRATVISADEIKNEVTCYYVDFGTADVVPFEKVRYLPLHLEELPAQAVRAKLAYVQPIDEEQFSKQATQKLIDFTFNKSFWVKVVPNESNAHVTAVILTITEQDTDVHINDQLVIENLAKLPIEYQFNGMNELNCNDSDADSIICDEEFGFHDTNSSKEVLVDTSLRSQSVDWEDELEAMPDDSSDISEPSVNLQDAAASTSDDEDTSWLLPELDTEFTLMKRARTMVAEHKAPTDSLQIIRTVVGMRRSALCKYLSSGSSDTSNIVDKINWLEEQIRWLDEQLFDPEEPC